MGGAYWILWCWNLEAGSKSLEENRKGLWCNVGAHSCGHHNQGTISWRRQTVQPGVVWQQCCGRHLEMQIHPQTDGKHGKNWAGHINYSFHPLDRTRNLGYGGGWARKTTHKSYHLRNSECFWEKQHPPPISYDTSNRVLSTYFLFLKKIFGMKASHKRGMDAVRVGLLNMSEQE